MSEFGYGYEGPSASTSEYNTLEFVINQVLARVRTVVPMKIMAVYNDGGLAPFGFVDAQPMINQVDGLGNATSHETIFSLCYFRLQGGTNAIIIDPEVGDIGFACISDRDMSAVKNTQVVSNPGSSRRFDLADGIYIGGILNGTPQQYIQMNAQGITIADNNNNSMVFGAQGIAVTTPLFTVNGRILAGYGTADQIDVQEHIHQVSGSNTLPPTRGT